MLTTNPQLEHVVGCASPTGAPQAMQLPEPNGLAVPQNSQVMRVNRSESAYEAPSVITDWSITFHILSLSCMLSISWARSSRRLSRLNGLRSAENAVCPRLA